MRHDATFINKVIFPVLAATLILSVLLVIAPFFLLGIHQQPANLVVGGAFDPKGMLPFSDRQADSGYWLYALSLFTMITAPIVTSVLAPIVGLSLVGRWRQLPGLYQIFSLVIVLGSVAFILFLLVSPPGRLIMSWWLD